MDPVLRAFVIYVFLLLIVRFSGKRTLAQITAFDLVLLLLISEAASQGMSGSDYSLTNSLILIVSLVFFDIALSLVKSRFPVFDKWIDGQPNVIVSGGKLLEDRMRKLRVDRNDVLEAARRLHGIECLDQIKYAILEVSGGITIIPK